MKNPQGVYGAGWHAAKRSAPGAGSMIASGLFGAAITALLFWALDSTPDRESEGD